MRKITREACDAFERCRDYKNGNTVVNDSGYFLHGNIIAKYESVRKYDGNNNIRINLAGWNTNTTRERLNGLRGVHVTTKQGQAYLNGEKWDGEWITVKRG